MAIQLRDPVHGFVALDPEEVKLLDTPVIQRLRGIRQLAMANLVYPGALHTRFDHSLGVAHVAGLLARELGLDDHERRLVRLAGLLHDVGHGPFSHVSEQALETYADRSKLKGAKKTEKIHELISARIIKNGRDIVRILGKEKCRQIVDLLGQGHGQPAMKSIVSGPLDADKQDYLLRDSLFCGVKYGVFDIYQMHRSLTIEGLRNEKQLMIKRDGIHAVEQYVLAKYYLTTNVYRHKVRLITDAMIVRAIMLGIEKDEIPGLKKLYAYNGTDGFVRDYCTWDDARFLQEFCVAAKPSRCKAMLARLLHRRLLKRIWYARATELPAEIRDRLKSLSEPGSRPLRERVEREIAKVLSKLTGKSIDPDEVIVNIFSIRSVRETSRNDEAGILVTDQEPKPFDQVSTLFASINEQYTDEYVEVYAPMEWSTDTDKDRLRREAREPILRLIETAFQEKDKGGKT